MTLRTYSEMIRLHSFEDRFEYLSLKGVVGDPTFGFDRWMNQQFYRSREWRHTRERVILRDMGCDLSVPGREIHSRILIHHMNPMSAFDIVHGNEDILDEEFLITTQHATHNAIHYGDANLLPREYVARSAGDTKLW